MGVAVSSDAAPLDPFDPGRLRIVQATIGVKRAITNVPVRKPAKESWIMAHPSEEYCLITSVLELDRGNATYLIDPDIRAALVDEPCIGDRLLVTSITRQHTVFLWPVRPPGSSDNSWSRTALEAVERARRGWVRVVANLEGGAYEVDSPVSISLPPPEWPPLSFAEILRLAFKDYYISDLNHPVLKGLRGEY